MANPVDDFEELRRLLEEKGLQGRPLNGERESEFDELRRLLLGREQDALRDLADRIDNRERRAADISGVLPQAIRLSRDKNEELSRALQPAVQGSIKESIEKKPQIFVEMLHPIIGSLVRRSIAESLRGLIQTLNQTLDNTLSWQGLKWRFEALRTGKSFAEVVMLRSLIYRVDQIFPIHCETGLCLVHASADPSLDRDSDLIAGMLSAIRDFAHDAFKGAEGADLHEFRVGEEEVWVIPGQYAYLAAAINGNPPRDLRKMFEDTLDSAHVQKGSALAHFEGDAAVFDPLKPELEACLREQRRPKEDKGRNTRAWLAIAGVAGLLFFLCLLAGREQMRWHDFLRRLEEEPGIAVTAAHKHWLSPSTVTGLRDPLAGDPAAAARQAHVDPASVRFDWKEYLALDSTSVRLRFQQRFGIPAGSHIETANGVLAISGAVPYEWIDRVRREAPLIPGISRITDQGLVITYDPVIVRQRFLAAYPPPSGVTVDFAEGVLVLFGKAPYEWIAPVREGALRIPGVREISDKNLEVLFDPALALHRFTDSFPLPDTVNASMRGSTIVLSGDAPHAWLARVRQGATRVPGVTALDQRNLTDLDQRTFQQSKTVIEGAFIYFLVNKDNFATEGFGALSRLPDEIRRCQTAAKRLGVGIHLEVRGHADAVGSEASNIDLSQRRATAVTNFLVSCGLDATMFKPLGLGKPSASSLVGVASPEQADRRVELRVISDSQISTP